MANPSITPTIEAAVDRLARLLVNIGTAPASAHNARPATNMAAPVILGARPGQPAPVANAAPTGPARLSGYKLPRADDDTRPAQPAVARVGGYLLPRADTPDTTPTAAAYGAGGYLLPKAEA